MSEVKVYRIEGRIEKPRLFEPITFRKDITAVKADHAVEKVYAEMGSRHRAKRHEIKILKVEEVEES